MLELEWREPTGRGQEPRSSVMRRDHRTVEDTAGRVGACPHGRTQPVLVRPVRRPRVRGGAEQGRHQPGHRGGPARAGCLRHLSALAGDGMRGRIVPGDGDVRHGTTNGYKNLRCRCAECRRAWANCVAKQRVERMRSNIPVPHGTTNGYGNYGCRCASCTAANTDAQRARHLRSVTA